MKNGINWFGCRTRTRDKLMENLSKKVTTQMERDGWRFVFFHDGQFKGFISDCWSKGIQPANPWR